MIRSAVTVSLVPEARGGPFVFWDDLGAACEVAASLGFHAVEVFPPDADAVEVDAVRPHLQRFNLRVAAVGTGAGWVKHKLTLTHYDRAVREQAKDFVRSIIDAAGAFGAPAIVGSMQGRCGDGMEREEALHYLADALGGLGAYAREKHNVPLVYEPLNRYETNLCNTLADGVALIESNELPNVVLLADLFHMNIEEQDLAASIRAAGRHVGHVHLADSNRRPAGSGHTDFAPVAAALREVGYQGYASAECLPHPSPDEAARLTIEAYRKLFGVGASQT